jgi:hypothetical protein
MKWNGAVALLAEHHPKPLLFFHDPHLSRIEERDENDAVVRMRRLYDRVASAGVRPGIILKKRPAARRRETAGGALMQRNCFVKDASPRNNSRAHSSKPITADGGP